MNRKRLVRAASLMLALVPMVAMTDDATSLNEIMQGLRDNLIEISDGLLTDDFELIAKGATSISEHPKIPAAEVQLVAQELGPEMAEFKRLDTVVHDLSMDIGIAAKALDRDAVNSSYQRMIEGCFNCHRKYEERVAAILKPEPEPESAL
jgi:cytochrome c556